MPSRFFTPLLLLLALLLPVGAQSTSAWETIDVDGESYVTAASIQKFYGFTSRKRSGRTLTLEKKNVRIKLLVGQQDVWMNNVKFVFSFPVRAHGTKVLVNRIDLVKLIDPVLRPHNISKHSRFDTVIIDPGHGGKDSGAVSPHGNGMEKTHALALGTRLNRELRKRGFKVVMTRNNDTFLSLQQRVAFANRYQNAIFISLHFNSGGRGRAQGIETFTLSPKGVAHYGRGLKASDFKAKPGNSQDSANIALATAIHSTCVKNTGRRDRGIRRARYSVITGVKHPAILLEGGFLDNSREGSLIRNPQYLDRLAFSIAEAIVKYKLATERQVRR